MSILRRLQQLRSLYRHAGIRVAAGEYEVFSTAPLNLQLWKQVPSLEEAVQLAKHLVEQHEGSILNVWHPREGQLYRVENRGGRIKELLTPLPSLFQRKKEAPPPPSVKELPSSRSNWNEQMSEYWQSTAGYRDLFWVRIGDQGDYEASDDLPEVERYLRHYENNEINIGPVIEWIQYGVETENFYGNNYISIYIGDDDAQPIRELSSHERDTVEEILASPYPVFAQVKKAVVEGLVYRRSIAAEPVDDVGFDGFIGVFDPDQDKKRQEVQPLPPWVLEKMRENRETIPEVTDEDVVKLYS